MLLVPLRLLISPLAIALINVMLLVPMGLSVWDVALSVLARQDWNEPVGIVTAIAVIMMGWGVALEERHMVRDMLGMTGRKDEERQAAVDLLCHRVGFGVLVLGLFAEVCVEMISLPDRIISVSGFEFELIAGAVLLIGAAIVILARHVVKLVLAARGSGQ